MCLTVSAWLSLSLLWWQLLWWLMSQYHVIWTGFELLSEQIILLSPLGNLNWKGNVGFLRMDVKLRVDYSLKSWRMEFRNLHWWKLENLMTDCGHDGKWRNFRIWFSRFQFRPEWKKQHPQKNGILTRTILKIEL